MTDSCGKTLMPLLTNLLSIRESMQLPKKWNTCFLSFRILTRRASAHEAFKSVSSCKSIKRKEDSPLKQIEYDIIDKCCDDFTKKNKDKILQKLNITEKQYDDAVAELVKLNPRPGSSMGEAIAIRVREAQWEKLSERTSSKSSPTSSWRPKTTALSA